MRLQDQVLVVVVSVAAMRVAVAQLGLGGVTDGHDFHFESEIDARERVVAVQSHGVIAHLGDREDAAGFTVRAASGELVAHAEAFGLGKARLRDFHHEFRIDVAVGARGGNLHGALVADREEQELLFEARDDLAGAFEKNEGFRARGRVEDVAGRVLEGVMETKDAGSDFHMGPLFHAASPCTTKKTGLAAINRMAQKDYSKLRELLLAQETFPLDYLHKFIGRNTPAFEQGLATWCASHPQATRQSDRLSANQGHRSVTFVFRAGSVDQLIAMLQATDAIVDLVMVL